MVIAAADMQLTKELVEAFSSPLIRFYYGEDLLGTEIGAAAKNVVGLAAGMLDGFGYGSLKGALMARGTRELSRLIEKMGGDKMTVYGLSHLGDYEATLFSPHSNNRRFGEDLITGKPFAKLAEGVYTVEALMDLAREYRVELPICETVYEIVHNHQDPKDQLTQLFMRSTKSELA
jgi:glycerol-3-phosphate dehydrogenase (NAD(P)+)